MKIKNRLPVKPRRIVGLTQAAEYCGVSRWTIRAWVRAGNFPVVRYPGRGGDDLRGVKVDLDDVDRFIDRAKEQEDRDLP